MRKSLRRRNPVASRGLWGAGGRPDADVRPSQCRMGKKRSLGNPEASPPTSWAPKAEIETAGDATLTP